MKLYQQYRKAIEQIGRIDIAWFTTFNLDVELAERFLLSAIVGKPPQELKTAEDYEAMNLELQQIRNVRIWYDYRAFNTGSPKRTTVDIVSVDPVNFFNASSRDNVFHPKIIFLKGEKGAMLMSGSANLSIGAWSSNREAVLFKEVNTTANALEIISFFERLDALSSPNPELFLSLRKWARKLDRRESGWHFIHSFQSDFSLFEALKGKELTVWSPYFSRDVHRFFAQLQGKGFQQIRVVPDITPAGKIRMVPEVVHSLKESGYIQFARDARSYAPHHHRVCHAKVWLTDEMMAVGSWNCSFRATGLGLPSAAQNIEAGILIPVSAQSVTKLKADLMPLGIDSIIGIEAAELEQEWDQVMNRFSFECKIYADWATFSYSLEAAVSDGYHIILPHNSGKSIPLSMVDDISFRHQYRNVLKNKSYQVLNDRGETVFTGFIIELNKEKRSAYGYVNLLDLFDALLDEQQRESVRKSCLYQIEQEESVESPIGQALILNVNGNESYYLMFVAFQKLYDAVELASGSAKLDEIGYRSPASLLHVSSLVQATISALGPDTDESTLLYHYFMISELNRCIKCFNDKMTDASLLLAELPSDVLIKRLNPGDADRKFILKLNELYGY